MSFGSELVRALRPYPQDARYLVGVSGGRDSVALLHGLFRVGYRKLIVCHLDHGLRGKAAQGDACFVQRLAEGWGLAFESDRVDVAARAKTAKLSLEAAARAARYEFFSEVAGKKRCRQLFLGHQADDQVETFLFNLLRGAGPAGLGAMAVESERLIGRRRLRILRPLLSVWRTQIDEYIQVEGLPWRDDATNANPTYATRNQLRLEVLPLLERALHREVKAALWRTADILGAEEAWLADLLQAQPPLPAQVPLGTLQDKPVAQQRRLIRSWLLRAQVPQVGYREVELVRALLDKTNGLAKTNLPGGRYARRRAGLLFLE